MTAVPFTSDHYTSISQWWVAHGWTALPIEALPRTGLIVEGVAAGFMYFTDSSVAIMEWIVSNPSAAPRNVMRAINKIVEELKQKASDNGYTMIFTFAKNRGLLKLYGKQGFHQTDTDMTHMVSGV